MSGLRSSTTLLAVICLFLPRGARSFAPSVRSNNRVLQRTIIPARAAPSVDGIPKAEDLDKVELSAPLPPILQQMADERREFEMNLGKAMDVLKKDYPKMLHKSPDFSIYHDSITVVDPSGVQLRGLKSYKGSFSFFQTLTKLFYSEEKSVLQNRMVYDFARSSIRISWNACLVPKVVGNRRNALYIDGVSVYKLDRVSGKIMEHKVENMIINNTPIVPPNGILTALSEELVGFNRGGVRSPAGVGGVWASRFL